MTVFRESRNILFPVGFGKQAEKLSFYLLIVVNRPGRGKRFPKGAGQMWNKRHEPVKKSVL